MMIVPAPLSTGTLALLRRQIGEKNCPILSFTPSFLPFCTLFVPPSASLSIQVMSTLRERGAYSICIKSLSPPLLSSLLLLTRKQGLENVPWDGAALRGPSDRRTDGGIRKNIQIVLRRQQLPRGGSHFLLSIPPCSAIFMIDKETPSSSSTSFVLFLLLSIKELFSLHRCHGGRMRVEFAAKILNCSVAFQDSGTISFCPISMTPILIWCFLAMDI